MVREMEIIIASVLFSVVFVLIVLFVERIEEIGEIE